MKNRKGFTLIEILAVVIIIGVLSGVGVVAVSSYIEDARKTTFAALAEEYLNYARGLKATDALVQEPKKDEALLMPLEMMDLDTNKKFETPYGAIDANRSYVVLINDGDDITYYINLVDTTNHYLLMQPYEGVKKANIQIGNIDSNKAPNHNQLKKGILVSNISINGTVYTLSERDYKETKLDNPNIYVDTTILLKKSR